MINITLVEPKIPQNTGTIARCCAATNSCLTLVGDLGFSLDDKYLKRAGLDYWPHVSWSHIKSIDQYFEDINAKGIQPWLLSTKGSQCYTDVTFSDNETLIFGSETEGLSEDIRNRYANRCISIPMLNSNIRSLNLANSVSIVLYEVIRQNKL